MDFMVIQSEIDYVMRKQLCFFANAEIARAKKARGFAVCGLF
jgi:hypothetical protein